MAAALSTSRLRRLVPAAGLIFAARLATAALGFFVQVALARMIAPDSFGMFLFAVGTANVLGVMAALGYPNAINRFQARYAAADRGHFMAAFRARALADIGMASGTMAMVAGMAAALTQAPPQRDAFVIAALAVPALAVARLLSAAANADRRLFSGFLPDLLAQPVAMLGFVAVCGVYDIAVTSVELVAVFAATAWAILALHLWLARGSFHVGHRRTRRPVRLADAWRRRSLPAMTVSLGTVFLADVTIVAAGLFLSRSDLAIFGVAVKLAFLIGFLAQVLQQAVLPDVADAFANKDLTKAARALARSNTIAVLATAAAAMPLLAAGGEILGLFGPNYAAGSIALLVLAGGQIARAAGGPIFQVAVLAGRYRFLVAVQALGLVLMAILLAVLCPSHGPLGAAIAVAATQLFWAIVPALLLWRRLAAGQHGDAVDARFTFAKKVSSR